MSTNYTAAIDFGSAKIAIAAGFRTESGVRIVSYHDAASSGIKNGEIINEFKVEQTVKELMKMVEQDLGDTVDEVVTGVGARFVHGIFSSNVKQRPVPDSYITESEVSELTKERFSDKKIEGEIVYEVSPIKYTIDEYNGLNGSEIQGMAGKSIEATYLLAFASENLLRKRRTILNRCGISLKKAILNPVASARAVLTEQEMENGVAMIDIGKGTTEIAIIKENVLRNVASIPFGGESITNDIKSMTGTTSKWAEEAKVRNGCCCEEFVPENTKLVLKGKEDMIEGEIDLNLMTRVIEARMIEILEAAKYVIEQSKHKSELASGIVITGGSCYMENLKQLAGAIFGRKVRLAAPRNSITGESADACFDAYASTVVGLVLEGVTPMLSNAQTYAPSISAKPDQYQSADQPQLQLEPEPEPEPEFEPEHHEPARSGGNIFTDFFRSGQKNSQKSEKQMNREEEARRKKEEDAKRKEEEKRLKEEQKRRRAEERKNQPGLFDTFFSSSNNDNA